MELWLYHGVTQNLLEHIMQTLSHDNARILYAITLKYMLHHFTAVFFSEASYTARMASTPVLSLTQKLISIFLGFRFGLFSYDSETSNFFS